MRRKSTDPKQLKLVLPESSDIHTLNKQINRLRVENDRLREHNQTLIRELDSLRALLSEQPQSDSGEGDYPALMKAESPNARNKFVDGGKVTRSSSIADKITLFRSYFRGRDDVYAVRGQERDGKAPYYPKREYIRGENGEVSWGDTLPLTNDVIRAHLRDEQHSVHVGLYPLMLDETCWLLAIDFDKSTWKDDATAFLESCQELEVPAALERSRSGNGGHVWIFFEEPIAARTARRLGAILLTHTLRKRHQIGLDSYDRMFPNQDTLPRDKKLGNLIALPLQRLAGKKGNSLFIDSSGQPYPDQWIYLSSVRKLRISEVDEILKRAGLKGSVTGISNPSDHDTEGVEPWNRLLEPAQDEFPGKLPSKIYVVLANMLYLQKRHLSSSQINFIRRLSAFQNPEFYRAQAMRLSTFGKPRIIDCSKESGEYLVLPRGCQDELFDLLRDHEAEIVVDDKRNSGSRISVAFHGRLHDEQMRAVHNLSEHDIGTLVATTAFGKTVIGAWMIASRATNTLVLVDKTQLLEQWRERLAALFNISTKEIGFVGGGRSRRTGRIDVALIQSVYTNREVKDFVSDYGHIIVDECHHISAVSFEQVLRRANAKYVLGLTATLARKDGKHPIVLMQCGPVRFRVDAKSQAKKRPFTHVVIPRYTKFELPESEVNLGIQQVYERLLSDEARNDMIFDDLLRSLDQGRSPLLLTDRTSHLEYFEHRLKGFAKNIIVLRGGMGKKRWKETQEKMQSIPPSEERILLATGKFVGEGFDDARLDTLFLVMPISWKGTLQQYAGRLHRLYDLKDEVQIYDYVDEHVPMLARMYQKRLKGYSAMGYSERKE